LYPTPRSGGNGTIRYDPTARRPRVNERPNCNLAQERIELPPAITWLDRQSPPISPNSSSASYSLVRGAEKNGEVLRVLGDVQLELDHFNTSEWWIT
jgi:hypothetical protein